MKNNIIRMNNQAKSTPISSSYTLNFISGDGKDIRHKLTGEETVSTFCPVCNGERVMELDDFIRAMQDGDIWSTQIYCKKCANKRMKQWEE